MRYHTRETHTHTYFTSLAGELTSVILSLVRKSTSGEKKPIFGGAPISAISSLNLLVPQHDYLEETNEETNTPPPPAQIGKRALLQDPSKMAPR